MAALFDAEPEGEEGVGDVMRRVVGNVPVQVEAARLASGLGDDEVMLVTQADNRAVLPLVMACGLRARIRMSGDALTVRVPLLELARARG